MTVDEAMNMPGCSVRVLAAEVRRLTKEITRIIKHRDNSRAPGTPFIAEGADYWYAYEVAIGALRPKRLAREEKR